MFCKEEYFYNIIDEVEYDMKVIESKESDITKYIIVYYKDENEVIMSTKVFNNDYSINNIIVKYYVEELDATDNVFEGEYEYSKYYKIHNIGFIHEFIPEFIETGHQKENKNVADLFLKYEEEYESVNNLENNFFDI